MAEPEPFGTLPDGQAVQLYRLRSASGVVVSACTYGATITSVLAPDRDGTRLNVALGFDTFAPYLSQTAHLGAIANLAQHAYFNLSGTTAPILDHELTLAASRHTPVGGDLIPTGMLEPVAGTPFDFRSPRRIGDRIDDQHPQLGFGRGYDHNWVLDGDRRAGDDAALAFAATVRHVRSGRRLDVFTSEPGVQFYSGNFLDGTLHSAQGTFVRRAGLCLETQKFPDSPNHPTFPTAVARPGQRYAARTRFVFSHD